jgi:tRNA U34 5-methylaminomethyl-2-thiouridine-forming methyltransferase MnmC
MNPSTLTIITTEDGSPSFLNTALGETYHSRHGAVQESTHVFIQAGLMHRRHAGAHALQVFEIGFGTGLNAALAVAHAQSLNYPLIYHTIEKYPISPVQHAEYIASAPIELQAILHTVSVAPWDAASSISDDIQLTKMKGDALEALFADCDVLFLDAFAPAVSPELWAPEMMQKYFACLKPGGIMVTYCAKGAVRRAMQSAGFEVERIPGPPGKREMLRATKKITR